MRFGTNRTLTDEQPERRQTVWKRLFSRYSFRRSQLHVRLLRENVARGHLKRSFSHPPHNRSLV